MAMADSMQVEADAAAWPSVDTEGWIDMEAIGGVPGESALQPVVFGTRRISCRCQFAGVAACSCVLAVPHADVCLQVEYYFSDQNLATDDFFRKEILNNDGWISIGALLCCNRIKRMDANKEDILLALVGSHLEIAADGSAVRRSGNAPLPPRVPPVKESVAEEQRNDSERAHRDHSAPGTSSQGFVFVQSGMWGCHYFPISNASPWCRSEFPVPPARQSSVHALLPANYHDYYSMAFHSPKQSREVQAVMDNLNNASLNDLAFEFKGSVEIACKDKNAHHVILKLIELSPQTLQQFLIDEMLPNIWHIVRNKYGCQVVRDLVIYCSNQVQTLVDKILLNAEDLCRHEFGRYVAQAIIENARTEQRKTLEGYVLKNIVNLSGEASVAVVAGALRGPASAAVVTCILEQEGLVASLAVSHRGSQVVTFILDLPTFHNDCVRQLANEHEKLKRERYGKVCIRYYEAIQEEIAKAASPASAAFAASAPAAAPPADASAAASARLVGSTALIAGGVSSHPSKSECSTGEAPTIPLNMSNDGQVAVTTTGTTVQEYMQHWEKHTPPARATFVNFPVPHPGRRIRTAPPAPEKIHEECILAGDTTASESGDAPQWPDTDDEVGCSAMA